MVYIDDLVQGFILASEVEAAIGQAKYFGDGVATGVAWAMDGTVDEVRLLAAEFHDVDFSTCWPLTVLIVPREHPNGRPQPISFWEFCFDLNSSEFEVDGVDSG